MRGDGELMTLRGADAPPLGVEERSDETPRARAPFSSQVIVSLSASIGSQLRTLYINSIGYRCLSDVGREGSAR